MPAGARNAGFALAGLLASLSPSIAADDPGYVWMSDFGDGNAVLTYGSAETGEDYAFSLICRNKDKSTETTLYVDIAGTEVGEPMSIELAGGAAKVSLEGNIATDEMSGFHFAAAKGFEVKPVIALLKGKGPVTATTGNLVTSLPDKGRLKPAVEFAKSCKLD